MARLLFAGLWTIADKKGRMDDRPKRIKAEIFPYDSVRVPALLDALEAKGFIQRYRIGDAHFIQIVNFEKHQSPHQKEAPSTIPAPDEPEASTGISGASPAVPISDPVSDPVPKTGAVTRPPADDLVAQFATFGAVNEYTPHAVDDSVEKYGADWVRRAIREAATGQASADEPPWGYVEEILKRWEAQGGPDDDRVQATKFNARRGAGVATADIAAGYAAYIDGKG